MGPGNYTSHIQQERYYGILSLVWMVLFPGDMPEYMVSSMQPMPKKLFFLWVRWFTPIDTLGVRGPGNQQKHLEYIVGSG